MKKSFSLITLATLLMACSENTKIGKDAHGCLIGQRYSFLKQACVQPSNVADIKLDDTHNKVSAIYVILSEDRSQAEIFAVDLPENTILETVKGGYLSKDNKIRLMKTTDHWKLKRE